ncbi:MAG: hypothetical protein H6502_01890 [Candidatus Woesearchaeota archaeon]|nr:MAG: hypothetical protein H6502_01890 [Candidatus Woesearchaeota archaeon]
MSDLKEVGYISKASRKLLKEATLKKIAYVNTKRNITEKEVYHLVKDFLREFVAIEHEVSIEELREELKKAFFEAKTRTRINHLISKLAYVEYKDENSSPETLRSILNELRSVVASISADQPQKGGLFGKLFGRKKEEIEDVAEVDETIDQTGSFTPTENLGQEFYPETKSNQPFLEKQETEPKDAFFDKETKDTGENKEELKEKPSEEDAYASFFFSGKKTSPKAAPSDDETHAKNEQNETFFSKMSKERRAEEHKEVAKDPSPSKEPVQEKDREVKEEQVRGAEEKEKTTSVEKQDKTAIPDIFSKTNTVAENDSKTAEEQKSQEATEEKLELPDSFEEEPHHKEKKHHTIHMKTKAPEEKPQGKNNEEKINHLASEVSAAIHKKDSTGAKKQYAQLLEVYESLPDKEKENWFDRINMFYEAIKML